MDMTLRTMELNKREILEHFPSGLQQYPTQYIKSHGKTGVKFLQVNAPSLCIYGYCIMFLTNQVGYILERLALGSIVIELSSSSVVPYECLHLFISTLLYCLIDFERFDGCACKKHCDTAKREV